MLAVLYVYARQLQLLDEEITRVKGDQNIATCRSEYIEAIWGQKLGQVFTSDFDIATYRQLLLDLVKVTLQDSTRQNIKDLVHAYFPDAGVEILEYWKDSVLMLGYDWQNTSFKLNGWGNAIIIGDNWAGWTQGSTHPLVPNLEDLGFILFGVQIKLTGISSASITDVEKYVIPQLSSLVKPAGIYYKTYVTDVNLILPYRQKPTSTRMLPALQNILGFGLVPFGSPTPVAGDDVGFGSPSLPAIEYP